MSLDTTTPQVVPPPSPSPLPKTNLSPQHNYKIRYATYPHDLEQLVSLNFASFIDDPSFIIRWPGRHKYPDHFRGFLRRMSRQKLLDYNANMLVIEDPSSGRIIAHADWHRRPLPTSPTTNKNTTSSSSRSNSAVQKPPQKFHEYIESILLSLEDKILLNRHLFPNPAADYTKIDMMRAQWTLTDATYWSSPGRVQQWHLDFLCVHPEYRRQGLGKMLVQWGVDRAVEEKVVCGLEASGMGKGLYEGLGFRVLGVQDVFDDEGSRGYVMMWDGCGVDKVEGEEEEMG